MIDPFEGALAQLGRRQVGATLGLVEADGTTRVAGTGRTRLPDGPVPGAETIFEIGSITKTFTALMLAEAVVQDRIRLDTPVGELLPGSQVPTREGAAITVGQLARHTSGLPRSPGRMGFAAVWRAIVRGDNPYADVSAPVLLDVLAGTKLRRTPGHGRMRYSNFGAGLLGTALVQLFGADDYGTLVRQQVLIPLGLGDTYPSPEPEQSAQSAQGHGFRRRPVPNWRLDGLAGAGALRSTVSDLLSYLRAQLEPDATPLGPAIRLTHALLEPSRPMSIGLGWISSRSPGGRMYWHNGGTGGFRSFAGFLPEQGRAVAVLVNDRRSPDAVGVRLLDFRPPTRVTRLRTAAPRSGRTGPRPEGDASASR